MTSDNAPLRLLWLASFSRHERSRIAANPELTAAIRSASPSAWRGILDAHDRAARARLPAFTTEDAEPMRRQALHDLDAERQRLASLTDGRRNGIFDAAARLARYPANGILSAQEVESGLIEAWLASGKTDREYPRGAIRRALDRGKNDPLPPLARRFRDRDGRAGR